MLEASSSSSGTLYLPFSHVLLQKTYLTANFVYNSTLNNCRIFCHIFLEPFLRRFLQSVKVWTEAENFRCSLLRRYLVLYMGLSFQDNQGTIHVIKFQGVSPSVDCPQFKPSVAVNARSMNSKPRLDMHSFQTNQSSLSSQ